MLEYFKRLFLSV